MNADFLKFKPVFSKRTRSNRNKITGALWVYYKGHKLSLFSARRRSEKYRKAVKNILTQ